MEYNKKYKNYLVIFIDMLGTQSKANIDSIYLDYSTFHSIILKKDGKCINDGRNGFSNNNKIYIHTHTFSDCAYILYTYDNELLNSDYDKGVLIENALCDFERIILKLLEEAIVFRGGVSYGKVFYEKEKNILFGPAINQAFQLEDKKAKNPRILVSDDLANIYNDYFQKEVEKFDNINNPMNNIFKYEGISNIKEEQGRIVIQDNYDYKYIFNYLNSIKSVSYIDLPEICTFSFDFKKQLLSLVQDKSDEASKKGNFRIKEKYDWLIDYIEY